LEQTWNDPESAPGNEKVRLHRARIVSEDPDSGQLTVWSSFVLEFYYWNLVPDALLNLSLILYNSENVMVFNSASTFEKAWHGKPFPNGLFKSSCHIPAKLLNDGFYYVDLMVVKDTSIPVYRFESVLSFEVMEDARSRPGKWYGKYQGIVRPCLEWQTEFLGDS
jgi:lipopolysaccharide transport system ATP-binding protein